MGTVSSDTRSYALTRHPAQAIGREVGRPRLPASEGRRYYGNGLSIFNLATSSAVYVVDTFFIPAFL